MLGGCPGRPCLNETQLLARFVAETSFADVPSAIVQEFKILVLDSLGAGFIGAVQPWTRKLTSVERALGGHPEASVFGQSWKIDVARATLINGAAIGAFECEPTTGTHASGTVL